jgi:hypothetical protein
VTLLYYAQWKIAVKKLLPQKTVSVTGPFGGADEKIVSSNFSSNLPDEHKLAIHFSTWGYDNDAIVSFHRSSNNARHHHIFSNLGCRTKQLRQG